MITELVRHGDALGVPAHAELSTIAEICLKRDSAVPNGRGGHVQCPLLSGRLQPAGCGRLTTQLGSDHPRPAIIV